MMKHRFSFVLALCVVSTALLPELHANAADAAAQQSAGSHFERGVALYGEGDYRAALTEFKRAYELAPNPLVLYNIGQAQFQLRSYSAALASFERYLAEAGANPPHAAEVQHSLETLKTRIGRVDVNANVPSEVTIDDEPQGKTPLLRFLVSVGKHRIVVKHDGAPPQERTVDIAAGDSVPLNFTFDTTKGGPIPPLTPPPPPAAERPPYAMIAWITTGALAAGAVVTGVVATTSGSSLSTERDNRAATRERLDSLSSRTSGFALATDILAATAIVAGGVAIYFTLSKPSPTEPNKTTSKLGFSPTGLTFRLNY